MTDYELIRKENVEEYGNAIGRIGPMLLANRYADRTHFIYELLQNAEDALSRRAEWQGTRAVTFELSDAQLRISHAGKPFDARDVRGICGIAESTKDLTAIGRFGIGFKSVYAFTDRPEIYSGDEHFAVESFVRPLGVPPIERDSDETVFILPLRSTDPTARDEIAQGLKQLGPRALLFLRQTEEIAWSVKGGSSGLYLRSTPEVLGNNVRRFMLIGEEEGNPDIEELWLIFSRHVTTPSGEGVGKVELAFSLLREQGALQPRIAKVNTSPLVVYFPTVLETNLGFLVQGPYRTTPSRDNVPRDDRWNLKLVGETGKLLIDALVWLRDNDHLDIGVLECLPLDRSRFPEGNGFAPLFEGVRRLLLSEPLLPCHGCGYVSASDAKLGRIQELRELITPGQLSMLLGAKRKLEWLSGEITQDRTPALRKYLIQELGITEITPESLLPKLSKAFLESQPDEWILRLYEFLNGQPALVQKGQLGDVPILRLEDARHVAVAERGQPRVFLPSDIETGFPTVRRTVCSTKESLQFLQSLGLSKPDPVDDVIRNIVPKYGAGQRSISATEYELDIQRIIKAFATDSKAQREKLIEALQKSTFIIAVDSGDGSKWWSNPANVYLATERLKELFAGIRGIRLVDDSYSCLHGEEVRELLEACGAARSLRPIPATTALTWVELRELRRKAGCEDFSSQQPVEDVTLRGLDELLAALPKLSVEDRQKRGALLWEALGEVEDRRGAGTFSAVYRWAYYQRRSTTFDAAFVRQLNESAWVQSADGPLRRPGDVVFESLGWKADPFLLSKLRFKPPIIEALAKEAGIEPGVLDLLKQLGVVSVESLRSRLGIKDSQAPSAEGGDAQSAIADILGDLAEPTPAVPEASAPERLVASDGQGRQSPTSGTGSGQPYSSSPAPSRSTRPDGDQGSGASHQGSVGSPNQSRPPGGTGSRPFISYVAAHPGVEEPDPDGLDREARMVLEEKAIKLITAEEASLRRTPAGNPGYDLYETAENGPIVRWIEVKAMTGSLDDRPVGVSRTQFECAQLHGEAYWLYVVEHAAAPESRIIRIQNPAGRTRTLTFDHGWLEVAETGAPPGETLVASRGI
jgi:hypothetical protein